MSACPDPRTGAAQRAFDPAALDDETRGALERLSRVIWRALLAADEAEQRQHSEEAE